MFISITMELWKGRDKSPTAVIVVMFILDTYKVRGLVVTRDIRIKGFLRRYIEEDSYFSKDQGQLI